MKLLVADDERDIADAIGIILKFNKLDSDVVYDGEQALDKIKNNYYDGIILDIMMPKYSGIEVLQKIREDNNFTPVLMLTAKSQISDKVNGLNMGADDYLTKPFNKDELIARINVMLRRNNQNNSSIISCSNITLDIDELKISNGDLSLRLAHKEVDMLSFFIKNKDKFIGISALTEKFCNEEEDKESALSLYIGYLRNKLKSIHASVTVIYEEEKGYCLKEKE